MGSFVGSIGVVLQRFVCLFLKKDSVSLNVFRSSKIKGETSLLLYRRTESSLSINLRVRGADKKQHSWASPCTIQLAVVAYANQYLAHTHVASF